MSDRGRFLKGLASIPLATVLANPRSAAAVSEGLQEIEAKLADGRTAGRQDGRTAGRQDGQGGTSHAAGPSQGQKPSSGSASTSMQLYTSLQIFSVTLFEKSPLNKGFLDVADGSENDMFYNQLNVFDS
jgi:hypothetical protein